MNVIAILDKMGKYTTTISFKHEYCYAWMVECIIDRMHKISIVSLGATDEISLDGAINLQEEVDKIQLETEIVVPDLSGQPYDKGYHHTMINDNTQLSYKRINNKFYLSNIFKTFIILN
jgi:hypothetical protein